MDRFDVLSMLFAAYSQEDKGTRMAVYNEMLKDIPTSLLEVACKRAMATCKFLPSIAELIESAQSIAQASKVTAEVKSWDKAWKEIQSNMMITPWGKTPEWSSAEIAEAVNSYGWNTLQDSLEKDMPIVRAQVRGLYESACKRIKDKNTNDYLLNQAGIALQEGNGNGGMLLRRAESGQIREKTSNVIKLSR